MMILDTHFCKLLRHLQCVHTIAPSSHVICYFQKHPSLPLSFSVRCISSNASDDDRQSFVVSYLVKNCGFSPKSALSASKYLYFRTPDKPDSTLAFLKKHGFSTTHIAKIIHTRPSVLASDPDKTILPKIQFFHSRGFSGPDIVKVISVCPQILHTSLENQLFPAFRAVQTLLPTNETVIRAIKRLPKIMLSQAQNIITGNIKLLRDAGLSQSSIVWMLCNHPLTFLTKFDKFAEMIEDVKRMGLNPSTITFAVAIHARRSMTQSTWQKKFDIYKKWGWSEEEIMKAFGKHPWCMMVSEEKIMTMMDYYINKMGLDSSSIAQCPKLISFSYEKRVIPRCSIIQVLLSKGLIQLNSLVSPLQISSKLFLNKFVTPYSIRGRSSLHC